MESKSERRFLCESALAKRIGLAVPTLRNHRHLRKGIPYIKVGSRVLYDVKDVDMYMHDHKIQF